MSNPPTQAAAMLSELERLCAAAPIKGAIDVESVMSESFHDIVLVDPPKHAGNPVVIATFIDDEHLPLTAIEAEREAKLYVALRNAAPALLSLARSAADADKRIAELEEESAEHDASFDIRWKADMRAIKRWQEATGRTEVWPDHADLCVWLLGENERLREALTRIADDELEPTGDHRTGDYAEDGRYYYPALTQLIREFAASALATPAKPTEETR